MAHQQVHRSRWIACRRRSAAPSITISRLSRGKTVEKCTGSRPARKSKSPERFPREGFKRVAGVSELRSARLGLRGCVWARGGVQPKPGQTADSLSLWGWLAGWHFLGDGVICVLGCCCELLLGPGQLVVVASSWPATDMRLMQVRVRRLRRED